jgi:hypothetical protein
VAVSAGRFFSQNITFSANWSWCEVVAVLVMTPTEGLMLGQAFCDGRPRINRWRTTL